MEDGVYQESRSLRLLLLRPDLAKLVRTVWIALAAAPPEWLRRQAAFGHYEVPDEDTTLQLAYKATDMYPYVEDADEYEELRDLIEEARQDHDFTPDQYVTIRQYYQQHIAAPTYLHEYEMPTSPRNMEVMPLQRLRIMPNLRHARLVRPRINETQFYTQRYSYWAENGMDDWAYNLAEPRGLVGSRSRSFPWQPLIVRQGLKRLPSTCKSLELVGCPSSTMKCLMKTR